MDFENGRPEATRWGLGIRLRFLKTFVFESTLFGLLKRRLKDARISREYPMHSFRTTGITNFLKHEGTLEAAQRIAGHADSRTTELYDRRGRKVLVETWNGLDMTGGTRA
jgi:integrase